MEAGLPAAAIQLVPTTDRQAVGLMLRMADDIDVIIPRGGRSLIERVQNESRVPVLAHLDGLCHVYLDKAADPEKARAITLNAKMRRTGICGAAETLLVDRLVAGALLPDIIDDFAEAGCALRGDETVQALDARVTPATEEDWSTEYLDAILSIKVVDGVDEAIGHINGYGSHHTDSIITEDQATAECFLAEVDSAIVMHNASTQFADGGEFGMGAEIGISTGRLHARGPVGAEQLTSFNYRGNAAPARPAPHEWRGRHGPNLAAASCGVSESQTSRRHPGHTRRARIPAQPARTQSNRSRAPPGGVVGGVVQSGA